MRKNRLIKTPLSIVYRHDNTLIIKEGLDTELKNNIWGVRLHNGVILSLNQYKNLRWTRANTLVQRLTFEGKPGALPTTHQVEENYETFSKYTETIGILRMNGLDVSYWIGYIWCAAKWRMKFEKECLLSESNIEFCSSNFPENVRLAVVFK